MLTVRKTKVIKGLSLITVLIFVLSLTYFSVKYFQSFRKDRDGVNTGEGSSIVSPTDFITGVIEPPQFEFISSVSQYRISTDSVNTVLLDKMLAEVKYPTLWNKFRLFVENKDYAPKKVVFKFADIDKLSLKEKDSLFDKTKTESDEIIGGISSYYEEGESVIVYTVYRKITAYNDFSENYISYLWARDVLRLLYRLSVKSNFGQANEEELSHLIERILGNQQEAILFRIEEKISYWEGYLERSSKIFSKLLVLLKVPSVYAQTCSSVYRCGEWNNIGDCPGQPNYYDSMCVAPGDRCGPDANGDGLPDTTCSFTQLCQDCNSANCGERACKLTNENACTTQDTCSDCNVTQCSWTRGPGSSPSQSPGCSLWWEGCGSCNCGHGAGGTGECVIRHNANCTTDCFWDSSGCRSPSPSPSRTPRPSPEATTNPCRLSAACTYLESRQTAINNYCNSVSSCAGTWSNPARCYGGNSGSGCRWQNYWMTVFGGACVPPSCDCTCLAPTPSCTLTLSWAPPAPVGNTINQGSSARLNASVSFSNGTVEKVNFSSSNSSVASVSPFSDPSSPYLTQVTGVGAGSTNINASAYMTDIYSPRNGGIIRCSNSRSVTVRGASPSPSRPPSPSPSRGASPSPSQSPLPSPSIGASPSPSRPPLPSPSRTPVASPSRPPLPSPSRGASPSPSRPPLPSPSRGASPSPSSPPCVERAPTAPRLTAVGNGSEVYTPTVGLDWNPTASWGVVCPGGGVRCDDFDWSNPRCPSREYRVYRDLNPSPGTRACTRAPASTICYTPILAVNQTHYWRVVADNGRQTASSPTWTFIPRNTPPAPPPTITPVGSQCQDTINFQWSPSGSWGTNLMGNINNYHLFLRRSSGSYDNFVDSSGRRNPIYTGWPAVTSYTYNIDSVGTYYWYVRASNNDSNFSDPRTFVNSAEGSYSRSYSPPSPPNLISPSDGSNFYINLVDLQWNANLSSWGCNPFDDTGSQRHFKVYVSSDASLDESDVVPNCSRLSSSTGICVLSNLAWNTTYWWRVTACNSDLENPQTCTNSIETRTFRITDPPSWYQTVGGDVHSDTSINVSIPVQTCELAAGCEPYLLLNDADSDYHGVLSYGTDYDLGFLSVSDDNIAQTDPSGNHDWRVQMQRGFPDSNYDFWLDFLADYGRSGFGGGNISSLATGIYDLGGANINGDVSGDKQVILLKNGDLNIDGQISVDEGSFLMVVVSGNLTVSPSVGQAAGGPALNGTNAHIQGVFIANTISTGISADHLFLAGTYVAWNGINLQRQLTIGFNNREPSETFIFRPDFMQTAPNWVKIPLYYWKQVAR